MRDIDCLRIEHKLDLILRSLETGVAFPPGTHPLVEMEMNPCPVCGEIPRINIDLEKECLVRDCGCRPTKAVVPGISALTKPPEDSHGSRTRTEEVGVPSDEEEAGDGGSRRPDSAGPSR